MEFSYENSIAPAASRFFTEIQRNTKLDPAAQARLQSGLLNGVAAIEEQRKKLQAERMSSMLDRQRYEENEMAMRDAAAKRQRIADEERKTGEVADEISAILTAQGDETAKRMALTALSLRRSRDAITNPDIARQFGTAYEMLPSRKPLLTPEQQIGLVEKGVSPDVLATESPAAIGTAARMAGEKRKATEAAESEAARLRKERDATLDSLLSVDPKFVEDSRSGKAWLLPDVHSRFDVLVETLGTPEEKKQWALPRDDDRDHARIAAQIQARELRKRLGQAGKTFSGAALVR